MQLFISSALVGAFTGSGVGAAIGYERAGILGALAGAAAGFGIGLVSFPLMVGGLFWAAFAKERWSRRKKLRPHLGRYWTRDRTQAWRDLKERLSAGTTVQGTVVLHDSVDCFLDIGAGFPARIDSWDYVPDNPSHPPLHSRVEATVSSFDDGDRQVVLTRTEKAWLIWDDVIVGYLLQAVPPPPPEESYPHTILCVAVTNQTHARFRRTLAREGRTNCQLLHPGDQARQVCIEGTKDPLVLIVQGPATPR
ncbi:hypothetical protein [Myxococcus sp. Y35]|uniref:hypothetical protein n=1 Tax=Pseudomyxococcus flavus TaxID=3115648 RepID=UPI003CF0CB12